MREGDDVRQVHRAWTEGDRGQSTQRRSDDRGRRGTHVAEDRRRTLEIGCDENLIHRRDARSLQTGGARHDGRVQVEDPGDGVSEQRVGEQQGRRDHHDELHGNDESASANAVGEHPAVESEDHERCELDQADGSHGESRVGQFAQLEGNRHVGRLRAQHRDESRDVEAPKLLRVAQRREIKPEESLAHAGPATQPSDSS